MPDSFLFFTPLNFTFILEVYSIRSKRDAQPELAGREDWKTRRL